MEQELDFAQKLLVGSAEIDRKKSDIVKLVAMLCGLMGDRTFSNAITVAETNMVDWVLHLRRGSDKFVRCYLRCTGAIIYQHNLSRSDTDRLQAVDVQTVHRSLADFAVGMCKTFPDIAEKVRPFEGAANAS